MALLTSSRVSPRRCNRFGVCLVSNVPYDDADSSNADGLCAVAQRIAQLQRNIYGDVFAVQVS